MVDPDNPERTLKEFSFSWGVYDTQDDCWVGNASGPLLYTGTLEGPVIDGEYLARAAATIVNERMNCGSRFRAKLFCGGPMRLKDEIEFKRSAEDAVKRIESRTLDGDWSGYAL